MNRLQQVEFEILKKFVEICDTLDLKYFLVCGSALGAAKYGGFIPWDDDVDVALPRPDYERFLLEAPVLLPENLFIQNYRTDPAFPHIYTKIRKSDTTFIEKGIAHLPVNHGIYIDVFPLDGYPQDPGDVKKFEHHKKILTWKQYCALNGDRVIKVRARNFVFRLLGYHKRTAKTLAMGDKLYRSYDVDSSPIWCNHGNWQRSLEYASKEQYGDGTWVSFEGIRVRIPERFDEYLTQKYGNWRDDPPPEKQVSHHLWEVCDPDRPYTHYLR